MESANQSDAAEHGAATTESVEVPGSGDEAMRRAIADEIAKVYDPEIPVNIYEMGLIYGVHVESESNDVRIDMTLTTPNCPSAQILPVEVQAAAENVEGVGRVVVDIVWDPPWTMENMSETARFELGLM